MWIEDNRPRLTPLQLEFLLFTYYSPGVYHNSSGPVTEARKMFIEMGVIGIHENYEEGNSGLFVTEKGRAWVEEILRTPQPVKKEIWVVERQKD